MLAAPSAPSSAAVIAVPVKDFVPASATPTATISASSTATLYVYREHHMTGMTAKPEIEIDGRLMGKVANGESVRIEVTPGKHNVSVTQSRVKTEQPIYDMEMEAGKEYWVRAEFTNGLITHLKLTAMPAEQAQAETKQLKEVNAADTVKK
jgi:hypothetical protein